MLLKEKRQWIKEKIGLHQRAQPVAEKQFISGEAFPYLGRNYRLKVEQGALAPAKLIHGRLVVTTPEGKAKPTVIRAAVISWYKNQAHRALWQRIRRYSAIVGVTEPQRVSIQASKSRWGSCSVDGYLTFNWRVMVAPNHCVDYIVVHELCHLLHHNHSPEFWKAVRRVLPDYETSKDWLKHNEARVLGW